MFNNNNFPVTVTLSYLQEDTPNTMLILIGVLGGLLSIGIIIAIIAIIKRIKQARSTINTEMAFRQQQLQMNQKLSKKLTLEEIDLYFPTIARNKLFPDDSKVIWNKD